MPRTPVTLNIKSKEVHDAAVKLARINGTTLTGAVLHALRAELDRCQRAISVEEEVRRMELAAKRLSSLPRLDSRSDNEILGYGEQGHLRGD